MKKSFQTYCNGCTDLRTGCFLISLACAVYGIFTMALAFTGIFTNRQGQNEPGVNITCAIWIALSIILIMFSIMLHWAVEQKDMVLLHSWVHFAWFFVLVSTLYVVMLVTLVIIDRYEMVQTLPLLIVDCVACTLWSGYLVYCIFVVLSFMADIRDESENKSRSGR